MTRHARTIAFGSLSIVVFDAIASTASRKLGFPYSYASLGSFIISIVLGYFLGRGADRRGAQIVSAGVSLGFTDATLGWAISFLIGPGDIKRHLTPSIWLFTCLFIIVTDIAFVAIGYSVAYLAHCRKLDPNLR